METALQDINAVAGVTGSFACASNGKIIGQAMPQTYDAGRLDSVARLAVQTFNALEQSKQPVNDVDLVYTQNHLILKNLRGGILVILCGRKVNIPLLNMAANQAVETLSASLGGATATIAAETRTREPAASPASQGSENASPLFIELEKESQRLISGANSAQIHLCVMDPIALWARLRTTRARVSQPQKRQIDFLARSDQSTMATRVMGRMGYVANERFNAFHGTRFLNFNEATRMISVNIFIDAYDMNHRVDLTNVLAQNETVMTETGLALMRLQIFEITVLALNELCALFLEHDLSAGADKGAIDATQITRLCAEDWGWYRTVTMNLDRLRAFVARELSPSEEALVVNRLQRLRQGIDAAPKSLRWQTRARIGDTVRWYETPQIGTAGSRPDLAMG